MVTITDYTVEYNSQKDVYRIVSGEIRKHCAPRDQGLES